MATISKDDFRRIRVSLAAALLMITAGAALVFGSMQYLKAEQQSNRNEVAKARETKSQLSRARDEEQELKQKIARFNELKTAGIIGEEQRLDWVEQILQIKNTRKLLDIQYELAPQHQIDAALLPGASGNFEFYASTMQLKMQLLHEEDLLNFLNDLRTQTHAFIRVRNCTVERLPAGQGEKSGAAQLHAECTLDWITLRERKST